MLRRLLFYLLDRLIFRTWLETFAYSYRKFAIQVLFTRHGIGWMSSSLSNSFIFIFQMSVSCLYGCECVVIILLTSVKIETIMAIVVSIYG